jgi:hypothetical protein
MDIKEGDVIVTIEMMNDSFGWHWRVKNTIEWSTNGYYRQEDALEAAEKALVRQYPSEP